MSVDSKAKTGIVIVLGAALAFVLWVLSQTMCG